jgi:hypothetical protein
MTVPFSRTPILLALYPLLLGSFAVRAASDAFTDPLDGRFDASGYLAENAFGFLPVPMIITEPAVDGGLGVTGLFFHEGEEAAEARRQAMMNSDRPAGHLLPPNVSAITGLYTGNGSWLVGGGHMGFFNQGRIRYQGGAAYGDFELDYYSIGDRELQRPLSLNSEFFAILNSLKFKLGDLPVYFGPIQRYVSSELSPGSGLENLLPPSTPPGIVESIEELLTDDITTSALGVVLELDTRDNVFTPTRGLYYEFNYAAYRQELGSDIDYDWYQLTGLNYFHFSPYIRAGLRLTAEAVDTDELLPPFAQPGIDLRGIPAARYQGSRVGVAETELTWQIDSRWSVLGFIGAGWAAESFSDFGDSGSNVARGAGFRYQIARRYGFHMGIDIARGPEDTVWYIQAGSAW